MQWGWEDWAAPAYWVAEEDLAIRHGLLLVVLCSLCGISVGLCKEAVSVWEVARTAFLNHFCSFEKNYISRFPVIPILVKCFEFFWKLLR